MKLSWIVIVVCVLAALLTGSYLSYEEDNEIMYVIPTDVKKKQISHDSALSAIFVHIGKTGGSSARCILHNICVKKFAYKKIIVRNLQVKPLVKATLPLGKEQMQ